MDDLRVEIENLGLENMNRYYSSYKGYVASNADPANIGRLQLYVPQVYGNKPYSYWALPKCLYSGKSVGQYMIPDEKDAVWVEFEGGDPRFPIWSAGWFDPKNPPKGVDGKKVNPNIKLIYSKDHKLEFNDENGTITIMDGNGNKDTYSSDGRIIEGSAILLGGKDAQEPAILGKQYKSWMGDVLSEVSNAKVVTMLGLMPIINGPMISLFSASMDSFLSSKVKIKE